MTAPAAGSYTLVIAYVCSDRRTATVRINGGPPVTLWFGPSGAAAVGSTSLTVSLRPGVNTVELANPLGWGPAIDRVTVR